eukprot:TRINITY_DN1565_c0_g1_i1.p1 TRINITY_DN1565_c0_g1~~TRINITY_DN1565_c0_g1_i1.p1  ORF type:complete len:166 (+),score=66.18 TRINITY_DN1565_c0_g1_i1:75-572(+)
MSEGACMATTTATTTTATTTTATTTTATPRVCMITRRERFSACHRLHSSHLSEQENKAVFGKCNNENGHGHNYTLFVTLKGPIDARTGMVMNLVELKSAIKRGVLDKLDHKNIDKDVEDFNGVSTTENVAVYVWEQLQLQLAQPDLLHEVRIEETENNSVVYRGE